MISKKEFAETMKVNERSIQNWLNQCNDEFVAANTKKGGYHNSEVFFSDALAKKLQWIAMKNQAKQGPIGTGKSKLTSENVFRGQSTGLSTEITQRSPIKKAAEEAVNATLSMKIIMDSGDVEAMKEFCEMAIKATQAVAAEKKAAALQQEKRLLEAAIVNQAKRIAIDEDQLNFLQHRRLPSYVAGQLRGEYDN